MSAVDMVFAEIEREAEMNHVLTHEEVMFVALIIIVFFGSYLVKWR